MSEIAIIPTISMVETLVIAQDNRYNDSDKLSRNAPPDNARAHLLSHCRTLEELLTIAQQQEELAKRTQMELKRQIGRVRKQLESK